MVYILSNVFIRTYYCHDDKTTLSIVLTIILIALIAVFTIIPCEL